MSRREAYTRVEKIGMVRPQHVVGTSDRLYRVFQCLNPECVNMITVEDRALRDDWRVQCSRCGFELRKGGRRYVLDYHLVDRATGEGFVDEATGDTVEDLPGYVSHDHYVASSAKWKNCILCATMKPLSEFHVHSSNENTGRQGECSACKTDYNAVKNGSRLIEQHREASQQRRLMIMLGEAVKLDKDAIVARFEGRCFKCNRTVDLGRGPDHPLKANWDHTRPAVFLWPMRTADATLLCREHNADKADAWPGAFYTAEECRRLARLTGIDFDDLIGPAHFNPEALDRLRRPEFVETMMDRFAHYPDMVAKLRNRVLRATGMDFFASTPRMSADWRERADRLLRR